MTNMHSDGNGWDTLTHPILAALANLSATELRILLLGDALIVMLVWTRLEAWGRRSPRHARWAAWLRGYLGAAYVLLCAVLWWLRR